MFRLSCLLLLPVIYCKIQVDVTTSNGNDIFLQLSGSTQHTISDTEISTFDLTEDNLKNAVFKYFGSLPDHAYLKSPTPWGDLYKAYEWQQVTTIMKPVRAKMSPATSEDVLVSKEMLNNTSEEPTTHNVKTEKNLENVFKTSWRKDGELTVNEDNQYSFHIKTGKDMELPFTYTSKWGVNITKKMPVTVGSKYPLEVPADPNQNLILELHTTKNVMKVKVEYEATLEGSAAVNFSKKKGGHHFWSLDVTSLVNAGDLKKSVKTIEIIEVVFHADPKLMVYDANTMELLYTKPMDVYV